MVYTNSPLVNYTKISPNRNSPRNHVIDTITIHCVVGQASVETLGDIFAAASRQASSNYGIGTDGKIGMYVEEKDRSWCSSSPANDHRAVTIEVASDTTPPYKINDKAYNALISLCTDICQRNGIKELKWKGDKSLIGQTDKQNMTVHRWFAATDCPGEYLYNLHGKIAEEVNRRLNKTDLPNEPAANSPVLYRVQVGAYSVRENAERQLQRVKDAGFDTYMIQVDGLYKIQVGAYSKRSNADRMLAKVKDAGFDAFITTRSGQGVPAAPRDEAH